MTEEAHLHCGDVLAKLELYLDGELPEAEAVVMAMHLHACTTCDDRAEFERHLRALVRRACRQRAPAWLLDRIRARLDELTGGQADTEQLPG